MNKTAIIIAGPTAVGKTGLAIDLALKLGTSIISADSRQCYQGMSIGTSQPTGAQRQLVPHFFVDAFPVTQQLSAADFEQLALGYLGTIFQTHDTAIVCGGTGLYIKALCEGLDEMPAIDEHVSDAVNQEYKRQGMDWLQQQLEEEDPEFMVAGERGNPARLLRALIFRRSAGESILRFRSGGKKIRPFRIIKVGLQLPRELLYQRINQRVDTMMQAGLLEEVERLYPLRHLKNLQTVGYTELFDFLDGKQTLKESISRIKQHTRNYAKRQMTWFRKDGEMTLFEAEDTGLAERIARLASA